MWLNRNHKPDRITVKCPVGFHHPVIGGVLFQSGFYLVDLICWLQTDEVIQADMIYQIHALSLTASH